MNSNLFHNIVNALMAILAAVTAFLLATGCVQLPTGQLECSASWVSPKITVAILAALPIIKLIVNVIRDGFGGLTKPQPPVKKE